MGGHRAEAAPRAGGDRRQRPHRPEIQALRAIAVASVILFHLWPAAVPGGFSGVDVFFVISGFLITGMLVGSAMRPSITGFWARRLRRLVPAALLALVCGGIATLLLVPQAAWSQFFEELAASAGFGENRYLAGAAVDYFAADRGPSPFQHFWTLSVEAQVYLLWPLLLLPALMIAGGRLRRVAAAAVALVSVASFAYALAQLSAEPAAAYFSTAGRLWEFGAGALLALLAASPRASVPASVRALVSWLGLAAIVAAALLLDAGSPFPGVPALLPVAGTVAVIWAGMPAGWWAPTRLLALRPMQQLGDISYAAYLWHWPILVIWPLAAGAPLSDGQRVVVIVLTIVLAALTKVLVEDPVRRYAPLVRRPRLSIAVAVAASAITLGGAGAALAVVHERTQQAADAKVPLPRCYGAASRDPLRPCYNARLERMVLPDPLAAQKLGNGPCAIVATNGLAHICAFGRESRERDRFDAAVIGDSHASAWRGALDVVARRRGWRVASLTRSGCVFTHAVPNLPLEQRRGCGEWNGDVDYWLARHPEVRMVIVAGRASARFLAPKGRMHAVAHAGYRQAWRSLPANVTDLVVLRDTPRMASDPRVCVERAAADDSGPPPGEACATPRRDALWQDPQAVAAEAPQAAGPGRRVRVVDLSEIVCDEDSCPPVIGGALVFRDADHLTASFSRTLGPFVDRALG